MCASPWTDVRPCRESVDPSVKSVLICHSVKTLWQTVTNCSTTTAVHSATHLATSFMISQRLLGMLEWNASTNSLTSCASQKLSHLTPTRRHLWHGNCCPNFPSFWTWINRKCIVKLRPREKEPTQIPPRLGGHKRDNIGRHVSLAMEPQSTLLTMPLLDIHSNKYCRISCLVGAAHNINMTLHRLSP